MIAYDRNIKKKDCVLYCNIFIGGILGLAFTMESTIVPISIFIICWIALNFWAYFDKRIIKENANREKGSL
jgi:hypothetical protein